MSYYFTYSAKELYPVLVAKADADVLAKLYPEQKLHCTMLYSNEEYKDEYKKLKLPSISSQITELTVWETFPGFVLVARLNDDVLQQHHKVIKDRFGIAHDREFNPHITLQKTDSVESLVPMEKLAFLIGQQVNLNGFRCIPIRKNK